VLIVHLSDIHFRKSEVETTQDPNFHLRNELLRDVEAFCKRLGPPAVIIVSGDVALAANMPLVDQFLRTNDESFAVQIYGVSAQGVSLDNTEAIGRAAKLPPSRRISIIGPSESGHDITEPLAWLISTK
jgi:3',5'-cyclic AMP phosphodiesterase CpdA